jgi:CheY-like chemotaxis protein
VVWKLDRLGRSVKGLVDLVNELEIQKVHFQSITDICDLGLPDGDGYELMRRIRTIRSVPGIAMSGYAMSEDRRRSQEAGFSEHLVKPIDIPQLIAALRRVTDSRG